MIFVSMLRPSLLYLFALPLAHAFVPTTTSLDAPQQLRIPHFHKNGLSMESPCKKPSETPTTTTYTTSRWKNDLLSSALACLVVLSSAPMMAAMAVSGGGLDYAGLDLSGQDFSNGNYKGKDFTQGACLVVLIAGSEMQ